MAQTVSEVSGEFTLGSIRDGIMALPDTEDALDEGYAESEVGTTSNDMRASFTGMEVNVPRGNDRRLSGHRAFSSSGKTIPEDMLAQIVDFRIEAARGLDAEAAIMKKQGGYLASVERTLLEGKAHVEGKYQVAHVEGMDATSCTSATSMSAAASVPRGPGAFFCAPRPAPAPAPVGDVEEGEVEEGDAGTETAPNAAAVAVGVMAGNAPGPEAASEEGNTQIPASRVLIHPQEASSAPLQEGSIQDPSSLGMDSETGFFTMATAIGESEIEGEIRRRILEEAVEADVVPPPVDDDSEQEPAAPRRKYSTVLYATIALFVIVIAVVTVLIVVLLGRDEKKSNWTLMESENEPDCSCNKTSLPQDEDPQDDFLALPTIELVRKRGVLRCGVSGTVPGFSFPNSVTGIMEGMNADHCRAVSLAVFGDPDKVEFVWVVSADRFTKLAAGIIDVMAITTTHTMGREVYEDTSESAFAFTVPFFYTGLVFSGLPDYVACADNRDSLYGYCQSMKACVITGTTHEDFLIDILPGAKVVPGSSPDEMVEDFVNGDCHILVSEVPTVPEMRFREAGYKGDFIHGQKLFSQEPLSLVTRDTDKEWSNLVGFIVNSFYTAEANGISKSNSGDVLPLLFGDAAASTKDLEMGALMEDILSEFGHYGDLYEKNLQHILPRVGINGLHQKNGSHQVPSTGLLYNYPFGTIDTKGSNPLPGLTLDTILQRGYLVCGITDTSLEAAAFASVDLNGTWSGFDVELCQAIAAAIFAGGANTVVYERIPISNATAYLDTQRVDVISGTRVTLQADYMGYAFSSPYYYDNEKMEARALMTLDADSQWSKFVFWIVMALVYAEEHEIGPDTAISMPVVHLFGEDLKLMLRLCVSSVGSYGDIYNRTLAATIPRSGGNLLNNGPSFGPQQFPVPFV